MCRWNFNELREYVEAHTEDCTLDLERITSIDRAILIYRYHLYEAKDLLDSLPTDISEATMELVFTPEERKEEVFKSKLAIQAHVQACIHSARSIHDLLAQLINSLILKGKVPVHKCDVHRVTTELTESDLKVHMNELLSAEGFKYINAFVNTMKHRNLVSFGAWASFTENQCGVRFKSFKFSGDNFPALWALDVLKTTLDVKNYVITAGCMLNKELGLNDV